VVPWLEEIARGLPSPRKDEPGNLRQDIADELGDHLACAIHDEEKRTGDESLARQRVLERFGDPVKIARRLWWDAMKENIMKDYIMLAAVVVMAVVTLAVTWMAFQKMDLMTQTMVAAIERLGEKTSQSNEIPSDLGKVTFKLIDDSTGKPAKGAKVVLAGKAFGDRDEYLTQFTDDQGLTTFGPMNRGQYYLYSLNYSSNPENREVSLECRGRSRNVIIYGNQELMKTIRVPSLESEVKISITANMPISAEKFPYLLDFEGFTGSTETSDGVIWELDSGGLGILPSGELLFPFSPSVPFLRQDLPQPVSYLMLPLMKKYSLSQTRLWYQQSASSRYSGTRRIRIDSESPNPVQSGSEWVIDWKIEIPQSVLTQLVDEARTNLPPELRAILKAEE